MLKNDEISTAVEEERAYERDIFHALWMGDFAEDSDKTHSDNTGDTSAAKIVQQRQGKTKDPPLKLISILHFKLMEKFSSST
jgi:hypothetical protein